MSKLIAEGHNDEYYDWENEEELNMIDVCPIFTAPESWYRDLVHYLQQGYLPEHWNSNQLRVLHLNLASYQIIDGVLRAGYY